MAVNKKIMWRFVSVIMLIAWLIFIFRMSGKNGEESAGLSYGIAKWGYSNLGVEGIMEFDMFHTFVRKAAHFTEYGILALLVVNVEGAFNLFSKSNILRRFMKYSVVSAGFSLIYACSDEFHQSFIDGRGPAVMDVCIDFSGAVTFVFVFLIIAKIYCDFSGNNSGE